MTEEATGRPPCGSSEPEEPHMNTHRYYPATKKDHERPMEKHHYVDHENEGMDTHTHTHRYYPVTGKKK